MIEILADSNRGTYIPQHFVESVDLERWNVSSDDAATLRGSIEADDYWDTWADVLDSAHYIDDDGNRWTLHQDGDLFAVCDATLSNEEYADLFGDVKPAPDDVLEWAACPDCILAIANDDYTGTTDEQEARTRAGIERVTSEHGHIMFDGADLGFTHQGCEICDDGLAGDKTRVFTWA